MVVPEARDPWTSDGSSNARSEAIMTPSPSSSTLPSRGWTGRLASSSETRSSRATRFRRPSFEPGVTFLVYVISIDTTPGSTD